MKVANFFGELKRRNVYKVAVGLCRRRLVVDPGRNPGVSVFRNSELGRASGGLLIVVGFPIALVIAWAFELTPGGLSERKRPIGSIQADPAVVPGFML